MSEKTKLEEIIKESENRIIEECDKQFPKGDKSRGKALVVTAIASIEFRKIICKTSKEIFKRIFDLTVNKDTDIQLVIERESWEELKKELLETSHNTIE